MTSVGPGLGSLVSRQEYLSPVLSAVAMTLLSSSHAGFSIGQGFRGGGLSEE